MVFLTDPPSCTRLDAVFPLCHENRYIIEHIKIPPTAFVLDLCTGGGMIALFAAKSGAKVIATDINPRAIEFARLNAKFNGLEERIDFRIGNLFEPVKEIRFDIILVNPPFKSIPDGWPKFLHSNGGRNGSEILKEIIAKVPQYLETDGVFSFIAYVLEREMKIIEELKKSFQDVHIDCIATISRNLYLQTQLNNLSASGCQPNQIYSNFYEENDEKLQYIFARAAIPRKGD
jgi:HemK-related putative methylase